MCQITAYKFLDEGTAGVGAVRVEPRRMAAEPNEEINVATIDGESPLGVGIIGAGNMGGTHARHWANVPGAHVVVIADRNNAKAERLAQSIAQTTRKLPQCYVSPDELFARTDVHVVSICVPTDQHRPLVEAAARAGKHILCEKPFGLTVSDCDAMIVAAESANVLLTVGQVVRFFPEFAQAKRCVDAGAVGSPAMVRTRRGGAFPHTDTDWYANPDASGGLIFDLLVHDIDWLLWCFGPIVRVYAKALTERLAAKTVDHLDYALLTLRHESGTISHVEGTWADVGGFATTFEIAGDAGLLFHDSRRTAPLVRSLRQSEGGAGGVAVPSSPLASADDPYYLEICAFAESIRTGKPLVVTPQEARTAVAVAQAARESVKSGRAVSL